MIGLLFLIVGLRIYLKNPNSPILFQKYLFYDRKSQFGLFLILSGLAGVYLCGLSVGFMPSLTPHVSSSSDQKLNSLIQNEVELFLQKGKTVGMTVALITPSGSSLVGFGKPSLSAGSLTDAHTVYEIGSITKTFTAITLATMIEKQELRLDQLIQELLPPSVQLPEKAKQITFRHLTTHSSGIPSLTFNELELIWPYFKMLLLGSDPYRSVTEEKYLKALQSLSLEFTPGEKNEYSNFAVSTMGYLLCLKSGLSYNDLIHQTICDPLQMSTTMERTDSQFSKEGIQGYRATLPIGPFLFALRSDFWNHDESRWGGAGSISSNGEEMLKYLIANMHPEKTTLEKAIQASHRELLKVDDKTTVGMNWHRTEVKKVPSTVIWHNGGTGGFSSFIGFTEDQNYGVLILSNTGELVDSLALSLLQKSQK